MRNFWTTPLWALLALAGCVGSGNDDPTQVIDLRILGMATEPPELQAPSCDLTSPQTLLTFAQTVKLTNLIEDPQGEDPQGKGRLINWELLACASPDDRTCSVADTRLVVASGTTGPGELTYSFVPGLLTLPAKGNKPLLQEVRDEDAVSGLGGVRMPLVLHLKVESEEVFAQKLMVFSCALFPDSKANVNPVLPGLRLNDQPWTTVVTVKKSDGDVKITPEDFTSLEENYVVPSLSLQPVELTESWQISWSTSVGRMDRSQTGGTSASGATGHQVVKWVAPTDLTGPTVVIVWAVVRDGRGGSSWMSEQFLYQPDL